MTRKEIGLRIRRRREEQHLSQSDLATDAGTFQGVISNYERGAAYPKLDILFRIAAALDTTVSELCREET